MRGSVFSHKKTNSQEYVGKKSPNDKSLEVNVAISPKKLCFMIFDKETDRKRNEQKT